MKEKWKYVLEIRFNKDSILPQGYDMYFTSLDQAIKRITEINCDDFIRTAIYNPFAGNQIQSLAIWEIVNGKKLLETEVIPWTPSWMEPGDKEPGIYFTFPQGHEYFEKESGVNLTNFNIKDQVMLVAYIVREDRLKSKNVIPFEALSRELHRDYNDIFTVDYATKFFGNGQERTRDIAKEECVDQYFFNNMDDALYKLLSTDFNKLDDTVAWENGSDIYYGSAKITKSETTLASLRSERIGFLQVGTYYPDKPGIFLKIEKEARAYSFNIPNNLYEAPGILTMAKYNEMRNGVIVCEELKTFLMQKKQQKTARQAPRIKSVKKQPTSKSNTRKL